MSRPLCWHREFKPGDDRLWHRCPGCGRPIPARCAAVVRAGALSSGRSGSRTRGDGIRELKPLRLVVMFTVTAPGKEVYPLDADGARTGRAWSARRDRLSRLRDAAQAFNSRVARGGASFTGWPSFVRTAPGTRGRSLLGYGRSRSAGLRTCTASCRCRLRPNAVGGGIRQRACRPRPVEGFRFVDGWEKIRKKMKPGIQAAAYLSSYFVRGKGRKASLTENVQDPDLPCLLVFIGRALTSQNRMHNAGISNVTPVMGIAPSVCRTADLKRPTGMASRCAPLQPHGRGLVADTNPFSVGTISLRAIK